jgi:hypothetical protein
MSDRRETILAALFTALQTVPTTADAVGTIERNPVDELPADARPAIRMYDGDEVAAQATPRPAKRKSPVACRAQPEVIGYVQDPANGAAINALLARIRKAIWNNDTFLGVLGENDTITQESLVVGFNAAETGGGEGAFRLTLSIDYVFNPSSP